MGQVTLHNSVYVVAMASEFCKCESTYWSFHMLVGSKQHPEYKAKTNLELSGLWIEIGAYFGYAEIQTLLKPSCRMVYN